jgi:hypothetical protein
MADTVTDTTGIVERLELEAEFAARNGHHVRAELFLEAAALIERLTSERDAARNRAIEECAKVADDFSTNAREHEAMPQALAFKLLAKAIRALGGQK